MYAHICIRMSTVKVTHMLFAHKQIVAVSTSSLTASGLGTLIQQFCTQIHLFSFARLLSVVAAAAAVVAWLGLFSHICYQLLLVRQLFGDSLIPFLAAICGKFCIQSDWVKYFVENFVITSVILCVMYIGYILALAVR